MKNTNNRRESVAVGPVTPQSDLEVELEIEETKEGSEEKRQLEILHKIEEEKACLESLRVSQELERVSLEELRKNQLIEAEKALAQQHSILAEQQRLEQERVEAERKRAEEALVLANAVAAARSFGL